MLRLGEGDLPRRGERAGRRSRSRPDSKRQDADGGVRAHWKELAMKVTEVHIVIPQSSRYHPDQCACCASHGRHHPHRGGLRTQQKQSCGRLVRCIVLSGVATYSLLEVDRGAGMSQRTKRP